MTKNIVKNALASFLIKLINSLDSEKKAQLFSQLKSEYLKNCYQKFRATYNIKTDFRFNGENILFYGLGKITCGRNSYIGSYSTVQASEDSEVYIGDNCSISHNVRIYTSSNFSDQDFNTLEEKTKKTGNVIIKNGVWIGANVFINPGITIGENAIVGSNSVVTKNIEPNAIYGGVPAKLIRFKS